MVRDEIIDAAHALVAEHGYAAVSMDILATQVGLSKPTLYSYFAKKEDIVIASILREMQRLVALFEEAGPEPQSPLQRLEFLFRTVMNLQVDTQTLTLRPWSPEMMHMVRTNDEAVDYVRRMRAATGKLVQAGVACGEIDAALNQSTIVQVFFTLAMSLKLSSYHSCEYIDPQQYTETMIMIFRRAIQTPR